MAIICGLSGFQEFLKQALSDLGLIFRCQRCIYIFARRFSGPDLGRASEER
jgi:hypothetical protein